MHEPCQFKCRLDASVCNNKQSWNEDKFRSERKKFIVKDSCDKGFIWNPSNCECECDRLYDVGEHLNYKNLNAEKNQSINLLKSVLKNSC